MKILLDELIPRLMPGTKHLCLAFEGKNDLEKNIPRKLRGWSKPDTIFLIIRDNDGADCGALKTRISDLCPPHRRSATKIRIVCQELEAWYFGDPDALAEAFGNETLRGLGSKEAYRDPDAITQPSKALEKIQPGFQKIIGARKIARHLDRNRNTSASFNATMAVIEGV